MKKFIVLFLLQSAFVQAQPVQNIINKINDNILESCKPNCSFDHSMVKTTLDSLYESQTVYDELSKLNGNATFGFGGNTTENDNDIYKINGGITIAKGLFPYQFEFSSRIDILIEDGTTRENVSDFNFSFDWHPSGKLLFENYLYLNRSGNQYLDLDQRYEIGGGFIIARWATNGKLFGGTGNENHVSAKYYLENTDDGIRLNDSRDATLITLSDLKQNEIEAFNNSFSRIDNGLTKKKSKLRVGVLVGAFFESEIMTIRDSLTVFNSNKNTPVRDEFSKTLEPTTKFRTVIRPFFDFAITKNARIKIRPYIKLPVPWDWETNYRDDTVVDWRLEWPNSIELEFGEGLSARFDVIYNYDGSPSTHLVGRDENMRNVYLEASNHHLNTSLTVKYSFN